LPRECVPYSRLLDDQIKVQMACDRGWTMGGLFTRFQYIWVASIPPALGVQPTQQFGAAAQKRMGEWQEESRINGVSTN